MKPIHEQVEVQAPVEQCYALWSDFERFPEFMSHVKQVRRVGPNETAWEASILGVKREWRARHAAGEVNRSISWQADGDAGMDGEVRFEPIGTDRTRILVTFTWHGGGIAEGVGSALGLDDASVRRDLENFKERAEAGGRGREHAGPMMGGRTR